MTHEYLIGCFRQQLRECARTRKKYRDQFTPTDEERALQTFQAALEHPEMPEDLLFEYLMRNETT